MPTRRPCDDNEPTFKVEPFVKGTIPKNFRVRILAMVATCTIIFAPSAHPGAEPVRVNPHQYNTAADYERWKMVTDSNGKEVGVWSESGAASALTDQPFQEPHKPKRTIPTSAIAALIVIVAGAFSRLRR